MKRSGLLLALILLAAPGCFTLPGVYDPVHDVVKPKEVVAVPSAAPVTAEEINEANAHDMATALKAELDRAMNDAALDVKPTKSMP